MNVDKEAFIKAICEGKLDDVERILASGSDNAARLLRYVYGDRKETILHLAVRCGQENIVKLLLQRQEIKVNAFDRHQCTALHVAAGVEAPENNARIIPLLLGKESISVDAEEKYGKTALHLAAEKGDYGAVKLLIDHEADITKSDETNNTAVHVTAKSGHSDVLRLLLFSGRDKVARIIGQQNKNNDTPLHHAAERGCERCVALLLDCGAATTISTKNLQEQTPVDLANGNHTILRLLKDPSAAAKVLEEMFKGEVLADSGYDGGKDQQAGGNSVVCVEGQTLADILKSVPSTPTIINVEIKNENHTTLHGGIAAIGPGSQINMPDSTAFVESKRAISTCESSYDIKVMGGAASIGDGCVTNVGTLTPSTSPSSAGSSSSESSFNYDPRKLAQDQGAVGTTCPVGTVSCSRKPNSSGTVGSPPVALVGTCSPTGTVAPVGTCTPAGTVAPVGTCTLTGTAAPVGTCTPAKTVAPVGTCTPARPVARIGKCGLTGGTPRTSTNNGPRGTCCPAKTPNHARMSGPKETTSPPNSQNSHTFEILSARAKDKENSSLKAAAEKGRTESVHRVALTGNSGKPLQFYTTPEDSESSLKKSRISAAASAGASVKDSMAENMPSSSLRCTAGSTSAIYNESESSSRSRIDVDTPRCSTLADQRQPLINNTSCSSGEDFKRIQSSPILGQRHETSEDTRRRELKKSYNSESQLDRWVENDDPCSDSKGKGDCGSCGIM